MTAKPNDVTTEWMGARLARKEDLRLVTGTG